MQVSSSGRVLTASELKRTQNQLLVFAKEIKSAYDRERKQTEKQEELIQELRSVYLEIVQNLAYVVESKDPYTAFHLERCAVLGMALANTMDQTLSGTDVHYGFLLHDVGKIGVPDHILTKSGPLTDEEAAIMQTHPLIGIQLVSGMRFLDERAVQVIRNHHERFDGGGYPDGLRGDDIPLSARVFSVVDAYDAMTTDRPYRRALNSEEALERLEGGVGTQFHAEVVSAFVELMRSRSDPEVAMHEPTPTSTRAELRNPATS